MLMPILRSARLLLLAVLLVGATGCDDDPTSPSDLAGTYEATTFRVTPSGEGQIDVLAAGGSLDMVLHADGTTTGTLMIPGSITGEGDMTESMAGTFSVSGTTVEFSQQADTFVRDLTWTVSGDELRVTNQILSGASFTIVLARQ